MTLVVDASAISAIVFGEAEGATIAAHIDGESLIAPTLFDYEMANIGWKKGRRHPDKHATLVAAMSRRGPRRRPASFRGPTGDDDNLAAAECRLANGQVDGLIAGFGDLLQLLLQRRRLRRGDQLVLPALRVGIA